MFTFVTEHMNDQMDLDLSKTSYNCTALFKVKIICGMNIYLIINVSI